MIEVDRLTKRYGDRLAVQELTFTVPPGRVTGFLGPNGAGKSTTMRAVVGLDRPTSGRVRVNGRRYRELPAPLTEVGALLEARSVHPSRSVRNHLRYLARSSGVGLRRVDQVLALVGLDPVAHQRAGRLSLGMGQRLGIAAALLGDPPTLLFDEPMNGLDPEGTIWVRTLLRGLAAEGRAVLVSSHLLGEMALAADHLVVIGRGRLVADAPVDSFIAGASGVEVYVRSPGVDRLSRALGERGAHVRGEGADALVVTGVSAPEVGETARSLGVAVHELTQRGASLEEAFMAVTADEVEYRGAAVPR